MGLEPVWKDQAVVLVSDAGGLFTHESDQGLLWRVPRYQAIQERQARALRKRWLMASFAQGTIEGAYWGVGSAPARYADGAAGYLGPARRGGGYARDLGAPLRAAARAGRRSGRSRAHGGAGRVRALPLRSGPAMWAALRP